MGTGNRSRPPVAVSSGRAAPAIGEGAAISDALDNGPVRAPDAHPLDGTCCGSSVRCAARAAPARTSAAGTVNGQPGPSHGRSRARQSIEPHARRAHGIAVSYRAGCAPGDHTLHLGARSAALCTFLCPLCPRVPTRCSRHTGLYAAFDAFSGLLGCVPMGHPHPADNLNQNRRPRHKHSTPTS